MSKTMLNAQNYKVKRIFFNLNLLKIKIVLKGPFFLHQPYQPYKPKKINKQNIHQPAVHQINHPPSRLIWWTEKTLHNVTRFLDKKQ